ncbi:hypothetical protein [Lentzea jiangxiensis]|uniref:hypothetical protein n=1 Tax=Lentzea jiangxiensis TaxID=641025 RepID=UPI00115FCB23|nr:hypothetical protein [Lentzea jiangxiensis]
MGVGLLPGERVLWQGSPVHRSVFLRADAAWMRFSLKFDAALFAVVAAVMWLADGWLGPFDVWNFLIVGGGILASTVLRFVEPFAWRRLTLHRTTYYVTNRRVVCVPGRGERSTELSDIEVLTFLEEADGSGHVRLDRRHTPDGFMNAVVAELIHVPNVREVVALLSELTGQTPEQR